MSNQAAQGTNGRGNAEGGTSRVSHSPPAERMPPPARVAADRQHLARVFGESALAERPSLFSGVCVGASPAELDAMARFVAAMDRVVAAPAWRDAVGAASVDAPASATRASGVCMGYDFHLTPAGPKLIEINTNAGGLALVAELMTAWGLTGNAVLDATFAMFSGEWDAASPALAAPRALRRIAIVDEAPAAQYLSPEFRRFAALFEANGVRTVVADPADLAWNEASGRLLCAGEPVDFIYNRLTDFSLSTPSSGALRSAWMAGAIVLSPHPLAHRLLADKRNLVLLADPSFRATLGLGADDEAALAACVLPIVEVKAGDAEALWSRRKSLFFKPAAGFGGRAAYRGDKLTKRVFDEILQGGYVAQEFAPPSELGEGEGRLKVDVRNYAYRGRVLAVAARLYQGQTTNFRTPGGGFAPVVAQPAA